MASALALGSGWYAFAADVAYTTFQMEFRTVALDEAETVIDRTIGSGAVDLARGEELLLRTRSSVLGASADWFKQHAEAKIG